MNNPGANSNWYEESSKIKNLGLLDKAASLENKQDSARRKADYQVVIKEVRT